MGDLITLIILIAILTKLILDITEELKDKTNGTAPDSSEDDPKNKEE